ncbi:MAG: MBL fold metallo-hydrolase [Cellulomonadaceae bacterium]|jgi:L-ascorbate metabolism protein UlaG (beta-lactamase superfamily)|nr:MBL fold metallo-hydrolase [Cellulomonadaceae bacterium]
MRLTRLGHACVRLEGGQGDVVVIDPGNFTDVGAAFEGADAALVTHSHRDHLDVEAVVAGLAARPGLVVYCDAVSGEMLRDAGVDAGQVSVVQPGDTFAVGAFAVKVGGGTHEIVHKLIPAIVNVTFLIDDGSGSVYHPGDSFDAMPQERRPSSDGDGHRQPSVLLVPVSGPWLKLAESIDFVRNNPSDIVIPIHDALNSDAGQHMVDARLADFNFVGPGRRHVRPPVGESVDLLAA